MNIRYTNVNLANILTRVVGTINGTVLRKHVKAICGLIRKYLLLKQLSVNTGSF